MSHEHTAKIPPENSIPDRLMPFFSYKHLPGEYQGVSKLFHHTASKVCQNIPPGPERTVALRKLLEAKDAAVRASIYPRR